MKKLILLCSFGLLGTFAIANSSDSQEIIAQKGVNSFLNVEKILAGCRVVSGYIDDNGQTVITYDVYFDGVTCEQVWAVINTFNGVEWW